VHTAPNCKNNIRANRTFLRPLVGRLELTSALKRFIIISQLMG
jgi:hypothetical protein